MLIYNYKKEFIGIHQSYLDMFNLANLSELQELRMDFADFFVKTPGHIYNFEHIHWIDYIIYNKSETKQKVIINMNDVNYTATVDVKIFFLANEASKKAYAVDLLDLCVYPDKEKSQDMSNNGNFTKELTQDNQKEAQSVINNIDQPSINYLFDPSLASKELGLSIELVKEFVQDFITQANEFKEELYLSVVTNDANKIKIVSHKLKGVAANLRIQDAFKIINNINISSDLIQIKKDIDSFYLIIDKLSRNNTMDDLVVIFKDD